MTKYEKKTFVGLMKYRNTMGIDLSKQRSRIVGKSIFLKLRKFKWTISVPLSKVKLIFYKAKMVYSPFSIRV